MGKGAGERGQRTILLDDDARFKTKLISAVKVMKDKDSIGMNSQSAGHTSGQQWEDRVVSLLKEVFPNQAFVQYEYLNWVFENNPHAVSLEDRLALLGSPGERLLLKRGDKNIVNWSKDAKFQVKQNDTADAVVIDGSNIHLIDVKAHDLSKKSQPPNIISAMKLAEMCKVMVESQNYNISGLYYIGLDWDSKKAKCIDTHVVNLFEIEPQSLYINFVAASQIQFTVSEIEQNYTNPRKEWVKDYIKFYVDSSKKHIAKFQKKTAVYQALLDNFAKSEEV